MTFTWKEDRPNYWTLYIDPAAKLMHFERVGDLIDDHVRFSCLGKECTMTWINLDNAKQLALSWLKCVLELIHEELINEMAQDRIV